MLVEPQSHSAPPLPPRFRGCGRSRLRVDASSRQLYVVSVSSLAAGDRRDRHVYDWPLPNTCSQSLRAAVVNRIFANTAQRWATPNLPPPGTQPARPTSTTGKTNSTALAARLSTSTSHRASPSKFDRPIYRPPRTPERRNWSTSWPHTPISILWRPRGHTDLRSALSGLDPACEKAQVHLTAVALARSYVGSAAGDERAPCAAI